MKTPFMSKALWSEPASHPLMPISGAGFREEGKATQSALLHPKSRSLGLSDPPSSAETQCSPAAVSASLLLWERKRGSVETKGGSNPGQPGQRDETLSGEDRLCLRKEKLKSLVMF